MPSATFCDKYSVFEVHVATKEPKTTTDLVIVIGGCRGGQRRVGDHPLVLPDDGGAAADCGHRRDPGSPVAPRVRPLPAPHGRRPRLDARTDLAERAICYYFSAFSADSMPNLLRRCQIGKPKKPNGGHRVFWWDLILIFDSPFDLKI